MKQHTVSSIACLAIALALTACSTRTSDASKISTTDITLSGTTGSSFSGFYVQNGRRFEISSTLPWSKKLADISEFEFRKVRLDSLLTYSVRYDEVAGSAKATQSGELPVGLVGVRCHVVEHGMSAERF